MRYIISIFLYFAFSIQVQAATGRILDKVEAGQADTTALNAEAALFKSIGMSIALSLAQCEGQDSCVPSVDQSEIKQLINTLNNRIDDLILRQQQDDSEEFTEVLTAYVDQRENYLRYQKTLEDITGVGDIGTAGEEALQEDTFMEESATLEEAPQGEGIDLSVFEDVGDPLLEDSGETGDLPSSDEQLMEDEPLPEDISPEE